MSYSLCQHLGLDLCAATVTCKKQIRRTSSSLLITTSKKTTWTLPKQLWWVDMLRHTDYHKWLKATKIAIRWIGLKHPAACLLNTLMICWSNPHASYVWNSSNSILYISMWSNSWVIMMTHHLKSHEWICEQVLINGNAINAELLDCMKSYVS